MKAVTEGESLMVDVEVECVTIGCFAGQLDAGKGQQREYCIPDVRPRHAIDALKRVDRLEHDGVRCANREFALLDTLEVGSCPRAVVRLR